MIVLPPCARRPSRKSAHTAPAIRHGSMPWCASNRWSSNATIALRRCGETRDRGTSIRYSLKMVKTGLLWMSYSVDAWGISPRVRSSSRPGKPANSATIATIMVTTRAAPVQRIGRRCINTRRLRSSNVCSNERWGVIDVFKYATLRPLHRSIFGCARRVLQWLCP